ncbi:MAG: FG-GAP-like repeat-containing protein [Candidatus Korobacteraceae bacterium]
MRLLKGLALLFALLVLPSYTTAQRDVAPTASALNTHRDAPISSIGLVVSTKIAGERIAANRQQEAMQGEPLDFYLGDEQRWLTRETEEQREQSHLPLEAATPKSDTNKAETPRQHSALSRTGRPARKQPGPAAQTYLFNKADFSSGLNPFSVAVGDFNGDGKVDFAVANANDNTVSVLLGNPDGTFKSHIDYPVGSMPVSVRVGDFNGDGKLDLAVVNLFQNSVSILLGKGDGTFQPSVGFATGNNPSSLAVGDFNGDGRLDLVTVNETDNTVSILLGKGDGTFLPPVDYATGNTPVDVVIGDFNGDGKLDIAVANHYGNSVSILLGRGDGTFNANVDFATNSLPDSVATGDFNGDGKLDLAIGTDVGTVSVLLGNGDGTFQSFRDFGPGPNLPFHSLAVADFNGDGKADLAAATDNGMAVFLGVGDGTFPQFVFYAAGVQPFAVVTTDVNRDGQLDLVVANRECPSNPCNGGTVSVLLGNGDGTFMTQTMAQTNFVSPNGPVSLTHADLNGDGRLDLVTANTSNSVSVYMGNGDGTFQPQVDYPAGGNPNMVVAADFRGTGKPDLAVPNAYGGNTVSVLLNNGDGTYQSPVQYQVALDPRSIVAGDFNHDGKLDMAVSTASASVISILLGNGDGTFQRHVDYPLPLNSFLVSIIAGDFNGDGVLDLAVPDNSGIGVLLGNGDGTFQPFVNYGNGYCEASPVTGDFNGDGKLDLATLSGAVSGVCVLVGNGDGTFQSPMVYANGLAANNLLTGDFNSDGTLDLAGAGTDVAILLGNGDGTFQNALHILPRGLATAGDFDGNGALDLAAISGSVNSNSDFLTAALNRPVIALFPSRLYFPSQVFATTSAPLTILISNPSVVPLAITNVAITGDFAQTNTCPISPVALAPGANCVIAVTFTPTRVGLRNGAVTLTDNSLAGQQVLALTGVGARPPFATYDSIMQVPVCAFVGRSCDSGPSLLLGRDNMAGGAEPNQPNTIHNSCADGTAGTFHVDESNDRLVVAATNGLIMSQGSIVRVTATVWVADPTQDALDLYYATNASSPTWTYITTLVPRASGSQTLSTLFRLRTGSLQAVRAIFRKGGTRSPCSTGNFDDHDDLAFAVR